MNIQKCTCGFLEAIHGFQSPGEFQRFNEYILDQVTLGNLEPVQPDPNYEKGKIFGGAWYRCATCSEIWRLVDPDFPFKGLWEKVDR
jgi:hypothetical protein